MEVPSLNESNKESAPKNSLKVKSKAKTANGGYGTGRRKSSVARVWVKAGSGRVMINKRDVTEYFPREYYVQLISQPFVATNTLGQFDVVCTTKGGGTTGQAGAIVHGIARALDSISEDYHGALRKGGFLTRDPRVVERKKYGQHKARKSTQFSKR